MERTPEISRGHPLGVQQSTNKGRHMKKLTEPKDRSTQKIRRHRTQHSNRAKNSDCSHQTNWKTSKFMGHWVEYSKRSCLSSGK